MGFMMWMAGSTVHLFNIGITSSALWQPISHYNLSERLNAMGFLPSHTSDWVSSLPHI
ncbi:hypothetical protein Lalb_Chr15g0078021 [Lupinus albus]|uniref:ER membrane protein complex subunit 4 n=1 Tax=Lupinus albus TaxID=3870 RepID=A0A6A4P077_LUPAL|nr:hypothetical protein Lalb_Chr15g0078021 [Lupinus albus]